MKFFKNYFSIFVILCFSFSTRLNAKKHTWHAANEKPCICEHMDAIVENFKGKNNLTMALGVGDEEHDYTQRFKNYTFVEGLWYNENGKKIITSKLKTKETMTEALKKWKENPQKKEPITIPLDFNSNHFFNLLKQLNNSFKEIIFDQSTTKFCKWKLEEVKNIFEALQPGGTLYTDLDCVPGDTLISINHDLLKYQSYADFVAKFLTLISYEKGKPTYVIPNDPKLYLNKVSYDMEKEIILPDKETDRNHTLSLLRKAGFEPEIYKNSPYPKENPWIPYPGKEKITFDKYDYVLAQKPYPWHNAQDLSQEIKNHLDAIAENFKGEKDLTMVLGAGDKEHDYTQRFKNYTFVEGLWYNENGKKIITSKLKTKETMTETLKEWKENPEKKEPITIPLDFNSNHFFNLLKQLNNSFKEIIFDWSTTKFCKWKLKEVKNIFEALQPGGKFYTDIEFKLVSLRFNARKETFESGPDREPSPLVKLNDNWKAIYVMPEDPMLYLQRVNINFGTFKRMLPDEKTIQNHILNMLRKAGFEPKIYKNFQYPQDKPWIDHEKFTNYDYILAQKPDKAPADNLAKKVTELTTSLERFKDTLENLSKTLANVKTKFS